MGWLRPVGQELSTPAIDYIFVVSMAESGKMFLLKTCCKSLSGLNKAEVGKNFFFIAKQMV